jgi:hypothetical protein
VRSETPSGVVVEPAGTSLRLSSSFFLDRVPKRKFVYFQPPSRQNRLFVVHRLLFTFALPVPLDGSFEQMRPTTTAVHDSMADVPAFLSSPPVGFLQATSAVSRLPPAELESLVRAFRACDCAPASSPLAKLCA